MHKMKSKSYPGMGRWRACEICGAAQHSGHWWLGGYKSKDEPPCSENGLFRDWLENAKKAIDVDQPKKGEPCQTC